MPRCYYPQVTASYGQKNKAGIGLANNKKGKTKMTEEQKNEISHRGKALRAMAAWLKSQN